MSFFSSKFNVKVMTIQARDWGKALSCHIHHNELVFKIHKELSKLIKKNKHNFSKIDKIFEQTLMKKDISIAKSTWKYAQNH